MIKDTKKKKWPFIVGSFLVVLAGVFVAWLISTEVLNGGSGSSSDKAAPGVTVTSKEAGTLDPDVTYDTAEGILQEDGLSGEGTYHLVREGGTSKYVALTSSVIDLDLFVDKEVKIWGETLASKKTGWLMDVAKVQVVE